MALRKIEGKRGVTWQIDYLDPDGKRVRRMFKKRKDAARELAARINAIDDGSYREKGLKCTTTVEQMVEKYEDKFGFQKSCQKKLIYLRQFQGFINKDTLLSNISYADIDRYINHLKTAPTFKGTLHTNRGINAKHSAINQMFRYAANLELIKSNPLAGKDSLRRKQNSADTKGFLSQGEIKKLLAKCEHDRDLFRRVVWALNTGMDHEDIQRLTWSNIKNGTIETYRSKLVHDGEKRMFSIPLNGETEAVLAEIRKERKVFLQDDCIFKRRNILWGFDTAVKRGRVRTGNPGEKVTFKTLRHTFASHLAKQGRHPKEIASLMGHSNIEQTMIYMHLAPEQKETAIHSLDGLTGLCQKSDRFLVKNAEEPRHFLISSLST